MTEYDLILFGVTGFTGKLAAEYLLRKRLDRPWAVSARSESKAAAVLKEIVDRLGSETGETYEVPKLLVANLVCESDADKEKLRSIVSSSKLVLTCSGPFEKYGQTLVELCVDCGVDYADITGETDFVRANIAKYDSKARSSGTRIVSQCGNDCIPHDLAVAEMHRFAVEHGATLKRVSTYVEFAESAAFSGGTVSTAIYQLNKDRTGTDRPAFDPLLTEPDGTQSLYVTKNTSPKTAIDMKEFGCQAGPWIMGPVMVNCVRRSNALLHYNTQFEFGDAALRSNSMLGWLRTTANQVLLAAAIKLPTVFGRLMPAAGEGPSREDMENGYMRLYARGVMEKDGKEILIQAEFSFGKDTAYLYTAAMLVEAGLLLLDTAGQPGGVLTPAAALGHAMVERLCDRLDATFTIKETEQE